jgi:predicted MFS family arabinose efflux permease
VLAFMRPLLRHAASAEGMNGAWLLAALALATALSQFHRAALGVVGPELAADLGGGPGLLGGANAAFFLAIALAQVPFGVALDRIGPRRTVALLTAPAVLGALVQAVAPTGSMFLLGRFLLGLGCAGSFMASVVLSARWHAGERLTTALGRVFALSQLGILMAGAPFAAAALGLGWRGAYVAAAVVTAMAGLLWWRWVRDDPPGRPQPARPAETLAEALRGQLTVWHTPGLLPVLAMHAVGYAAMVTVLAVWAGPYLADRYGLSPETRGLVLTAMGLVLPAGQLAVGPLEHAEMAGGGVRFRRHPRPDLARVLGTPAAALRHRAATAARGAVLLPDRSGRAWPFAIS